MIYTFIAYAPKEHDRDIAWIDNKYMELLPNDDDWACFIDHDAMFTTLDWYHQLMDIIEKNPEYSCFTSMTNRLYSSWQIPKGIDEKTHDIIYHRKIGLEIQAENYNQVIDITDCEDLPKPPGVPTREKIPLCDVMLLIKKSAWKKVPFRKYNETMYGVDNMLHLDMRDNGYKVGLMTGVYLYHWHRAFQDGSVALPTKKEGELDVPVGLSWMKEAQFESTEKVDMDVKAARHKIKQCDGGNFVIIGSPLPYTREIDLLTCLWIEYQKRKDNMMALYEPTRFASLGRNNVIHKTLTYLQGATHVFFVDKDVLPPIDAIERLMAHDKDIVVGCTPIYKDEPMWSVMKYDPNETIDNAFHPIPYLELPKELFRAHHFGGTTCLIKRHVLEKMEYPWYQDIFKPGKLLLGQDLFFTAKAKKMDFELWCDPTIQCEHTRHNEMKTVFDNFKGKMEELQERILIAEGNLEDVHRRRLSHVK